MGCVRIGDAEQFVEPVLGVCDGLGQLETEGTQPGGADGHQQGCRRPTSGGQVPQALSDQVGAGEIGSDGNHAVNGTTRARPGRGRPAQEVLAERRSLTINIPRPHPGRASRRIEEPQERTRQGRGVERSAAGYGQGMNDPSLEDHVVGLELQLVELVEQRERATVQDRPADAARIEREIATLQEEMARTAEAIARPD